jgi:biotin carboxylase
VEDVERILAMEDAPVIVKPRVGTGSVATFRVTDTAHLRRLRDRGAFSTAQRLTTLGQSTL